MSYAIQVIMIKAFSSNQFARAILYKVLFSFRSTLIIAQNLALNLNYLFLDVSEISLSSSPATYILMYCTASSMAFTAVSCFQFKKRYNVLVLKATWFSHVGKIPGNQ